MFIFNSRRAEENVLIHSLLIIFHAFINVSVSFLSAQISIPIPFFLDTYVKVAMFNSIGQQLSKCKTSIRRNMIDPEFNETFVFQIIEFELPSVSIMFSVINIKKMRRKEIIGWFSIGHDSTGDEEDVHWRAVMNARGQPIRRWHILSSVDF